MASETEEQELLTTKQTIEALGISRATLYHLIDRNEIKPVEQDTILAYPHLKFRASDVRALRAKKMAEREARRSRRKREQA